ncbi:3,4-dihydroxy-2-butanone-4-phosphate synthase [Lentisphaerota bacterium ZTH]|nr:3,4-dihydroxy-2-butanone-4-phosphate synthase [Lentisphaerota bacterium]WET06945.1 3,4-dihydroxy-2-butanone-4-phosphate synthase [Lentisphaerota bacterium ZTH]
MNQIRLETFGTKVIRVENALRSLQLGNGVLVIDNEDRENEGDLIFSAESLDEEKMAVLIRECSGIVCLCLPEEKIASLKLPMMIEKNTSTFNTAFTVSIEAKNGVTTGVSAKDRVQTIKTAISDEAKPDDLNKPGHVFPLAAKSGGVLEREGHTEATVDLMKLAGLKPYGVLCELTKSNGEMAKLPEILSFAKNNSYPVVTVNDIIGYRRTKESYIKYL